MLEKDKVVTKKEDTKKKGGKKNRSKAKGGEFERKICKILSLWVSNGTRDDIFWRSAMSGGRASVRFKNTGQQSVAQGGDISPIGEQNALTDQFCIECKSYKKLHYSSLLFLKPKDRSFVQFWNQTVETAKKHGKLPMLIAKQNGLPDVVVCISGEGLVRLSPAMPKHLYSSGLNMYIFTLMEFIDNFLVVRTPTRRRLVK